MWMWIWLGCGTAPDAESCRPYCQAAEAPAPEAAPEAASTAPAPAGAATLTAFEQEKLGPVIEDLRAGVRPFSEGSVGICKGSGPECEERLGLSPGELPPGEYHLNAELAVPRIGEKGDWTVDLLVECTSTVTLGNGEKKQTTSKPSSRSHTVTYAGTERGYRLAPLWKITSPSKGQGSKDCRYKLTAPHPDGDKVISGSWMVPAPE